MTIKEHHLLSMWYTACIKVQAERLTDGKQDPAPTAGEMGRVMGVSRQTAKKYMLRLVGEGYLAPHEYTEKNGVVGVRYHVG